ncbi:MAG: hypothetical protein Fur0042_11120 [Cyanophyceae cyanobacterium]
MAVQRAVGRTVLWANVIALAALQGAISCAWVTYRLYLPELLASVGLAGWGSSVLLLETGLAVALEPLAGWWSDRAWSRLEGRFPLVAIAVLVAAVLLMGLPPLATAGPGVAVLMVAILLGWAVAMAAFRSPAIALLRNYALASQLPQAMGILTFALALVGAIAGPLQGWLASLGAAVALGGSSALLVAAAGLMAIARPANALAPEGSAPPEAPDALPEEAVDDDWGDDSPAVLLIETAPRSRLPHLAIVALGMAVAMALRLWLSTLGAAGDRWFPDLDGGLIPFGAGIAVAFLAVPAGAVAALWGLGRTLMQAAIALAMLWPFFTIIASPYGGIVLLILAIVGWSTLFNGAIPLLLGAAPRGREGVAIGLYFGGFAATNLLLGIPAIAANVLGSDANLGRWGQVTFIAIALLARDLGQTPAPQTSRPLP